MDTTRRSWRAAAVVAVTAMALAVAPFAGTASAADPLPPAANPLGEGAFCDGAPSAHPFTDLGAESAATRQVIICLVAAELTSGTSATEFTPGGTVTRRQMALFIKRTADLFNELETGDLEDLPAYDGEPDFTDVAGEQPAFREAIGQLSQAGIVGGVGGGRFEPGTPVTRRQMAAFVNRLVEFLTGTPYTTSGDFFDDDEGDPGEENLNALAAAGIFQGDGQGNVDPGGLLTRRQMANILLRNAQAQFTADRIGSPFEDEPPAGNVNLAPDEALTVEYVEDIDATTPEDDRTYTASSLPASAGGYRVTLVDSDNITPDAGSRRFAEDGNTGLADAGTVAARIVSVNGTNVTAAQSVGAIQPVDGTITIVIDGNGTESVTPVIYVDGGANTRLELDDTGHATEAHDTGGATQYIPAEAEAGSMVSGTVLLAGSDFAVVDSGGPVTVYFHGEDTYRIGSFPPFDVVEPAVFHAALSPGDMLRTCQSNLGALNFYAQDAANEYCLDDTTPVNPTDVTPTAGTPRDTSIQLAWAAADPADSYNVYSNDEICENTSVAQGELTHIATVPATTTQYTATALAPATTYCFVVTTVESGDESPVTRGTGAADGDNTAGFTTSGVLEAPRITSAALTTDAAPTDGEVSTGDVITLVFSETMSGSVDGADITVVEVNGGDTTTIRCSDDGTVAGNNSVTLATCALGDGTDAGVEDDTLTITLRENGDDANVQGGNDGLVYPLDITGTTVLEDDDDGEAVDVAGSPDKRIG